VWALFGREVSMGHRPLRVFISYAWEDEAHKQWVQRLAAQLRDDGVLARLDEWDRKDGQSIQGFMTSEVEDADRVVIVCSPKYKERVQAMDRAEAVSGVGWEWCVLSTEMFQAGVMGKAVAVIARGSRADAVPTIIKSCPVFDLTSDYTRVSDYNRMFECLTGQRPAGPGVAPELRKVKHARVLSLLEGQGARTTARHNLPFARNDRFIGREAEIEALHKALNPVSPIALTQPTWSLTGMGGVGKTQTAVEYAYRHLDDYEKILWVDAGGEDVIAPLAALGPVLGLAAGEAMPLPEQAVAVRQALESGPRYLLILDNVEGPGVCEDLLPRDGQTRVLITTRRRDLGFRKIEVDVLPPERALELLLAGADVEGQDLSDAKALCKEFGHLALAVDVASRILSLHVRTVSDLLVSVRKRGTIAWSEDASEDNLFHKRPELGHLFETSFSLLSEDAPEDNIARHMLLCAGWFGPVGIELELLGTAADRSARGGGASGGNTEHYARAAERLVALGLARSETGGYLAFHRVVRDFARRKGGVTYRRVVHDVLSARAGATRGETLELLGLVPMRPHLETLLSDLTRDATVSDIETAVRIAQHYWHCGQYREALRVAERGLTLTDGEGVTARLLAEKGDALRSLGRYDEAMESQRRSLAITEKVLGEEHPETAITLNAIGQTLHSQGKYDEALEYYRRSLAIKEKVLGEEHPETAISRFEVGRVLREMGDPKGEKDMREAAQLLERRLGAQHPTVVAAKAWLGEE
jgi:hypothetical protein